MEFERDLKGNLEWRHEQLRTGCYQPQAVMRRLIPIGLGLFFRPMAFISIRSGCPLHHTHFSLLDKKQPLQGLPAEC